MNEFCSDPCPETHAAHEDTEYQDLGIGRMPQEQF